MSARRFLRWQGTLRRGRVMMLGAPVFLLATLPALAQTPSARPLPPSDPPANPQPATQAAYTLGTPELKLQYRLQRDKQTGVVHLASAVPAPKTVTINWEPSFGPVPENPILLQTSLNLNIRGNKVPCTFTTATPVVPQNGQWSIDVSDLASKLIGEINNTLSPNYDPGSADLPLDAQATVKVIPILKAPAQYVPGLVKGPASAVNKGQLKLTPVLTLGEADGS